MPKDNRALTSDEYCSQFISKTELFLAGTALFLIGIGIGMIFYDHLLMSLLTGFLMLLFLKEYLRYKKNKIKLRILDEFILINNILLGELSGHASVENIYRKLSQDAAKDRIMGLSLLKRELLLWGKSIEIGESPEVIIGRFARALQDQTVLQYAYVFKLAMKQGVDIKRVVSNTNRILREKLRIKNEIEVLIAEKKLEQKMMSVMPFLMIVFLKMTAGSFLSPLYTTIVGRVTMSALLVIFGICYIWSNRITEIL